MRINIIHQLPKHLKHLFIVCKTCPKTSSQHSSRVIKNPSIHLEWYKKTTIYWLNNAIQRRDLYHLRDIDDGLRLISPDFDGKYHRQRRLVHPRRKSPSTSPSLVTVFLSNPIPTIVSRRNCHPQSNLRVWILEGTVLRLNWFAFLYLAHP